MKGQHVQAFQLSSGGRKVKLRREGFLELEVSCRYKVYLPEMDGNMGAVRPITNCDTPLQHA